MKKRRKKRNMGGGMPAKGIGGMPAKGIGGGVVETFPKQLTLEQYFACPIWFADEPVFVDKLNKKLQNNVFELF